MGYYHIMRRFTSIIFALLITLCQLLCSPPIVECFDERAGAAAALEELGKLMEERAREQRQLEQQKELLRYQYKLDEERQRLKEETRRLELENEKEAEQNATYTGTGFFVNTAGYLITNAHVVEDKSYITIRDSKGKFFHAKVIAQDKQNDFALLQVDGNFPALRIIHSDQVKKGQRVFTVGYPQISIQGNESKVTDGIINSFSGIKDDASWFQISVPVQGGNSGGPLINEHGDVIGVVVASIDVQKYYSITGNMPQNVNYAIKSKVLMQFLSTHQIRNTSEFNEKNSIEYVDRGTVLVIAQNSPIDASYEERPVNKNAEDAKLTKLHPNWLSIVQSIEFKNWLDKLPSEKNSFESQRAVNRARVLDNYKLYLKEQKEAAIRTASENVKKEKERKTLEQVTRTYPDWPDLKEDPEFIDWLKIQPQPTKILIESLNAPDIIAIVKRYKEQPIKKLIEIGKVETIFQQYGYIVFSLNDTSNDNIDKAILLSNGKKIEGIVEKRFKGKISLNIDGNDIDNIKINDSVFVFQ